MQNNFFNEIGDERDNLVVIKGKKDIPFTSKRVFYMYGSDPDIIRGQHTNRPIKLCTY